MELPNYIVNKYKGLFLRAKELCDEKKFKEAKELLAVVVEKDVANYEANYRLAEILYKGYESEPNYDEAFKNYYYAASNNYKKAFLKVGICYFEEKGTPRDYSQALVWLERAAKNGESEAFYYIGYIYLNGLSVSKNEPKALMWFLKAAHKGVVEAQVEAAKIYENRSEDLGAATLYLAAAKNGSLYATEKIGDYYSEGKGINQSKELAKDFYEKAVKLGSRTAELKITTLFDDENKEDDELKKQVDIYIRSAKEGNAQAAKMLGDAYYNGLGVNQDYYLAYSWWNKAAIAGDNDAMVILANFLMEPKTDRVERDLVTAKYWLLKASENGHPEAMYQLGLALERATLFNEVNYQDAYKWFNLASKKGHKAAKEALKKYRKSLTGKVKLRNKK